MADNDTPNRVQVVWNMIGGDSIVDQLIAGTKRLVVVESVLEGAALDSALHAAARVDKNTTHLRYLSSTTLAPTKGSVTIAQSADVFPGFLDPNFEGWDTNVAGVDTAEMSADIYEMKKKDGTYAQLFGSLTGAQGSYEEVVAACHPLCWQQGQIVEFARSHRALLRQDGYATLFLFKVDGEVFVAYVRVGGGGLLADVYRFSDTFVWRADHRHRVVVPQQTV